MIESKIECVAFHESAEYDRDPILVQISNQAKEGWHFVGMRDGKVRRESHAYFRCGKTMYILYFQRVV